VLKDDGADHDPEDLLAVLVGRGWRVPQLAQALTKARELCEGAVVEGDRRRLLPVEQASELLGFAHRRFQLTLKGLRDLGAARIEAQESP
jgi:hypothetical protein